LLAWPHNNPVQNVKLVATNEQNTFITSNSQWLDTKANMKKHQNEDIQALF